MQFNNSASTKNMKTLDVAKPIHRSPLRRALLLIAPALVIISVLTAVPARATPACGLSTVILALEHFPSGSLDLMCNEFDQYGWNLKLKVKGDSDVYIVQNTFPVGAHSGWHTHPGPSLVTVTPGTITPYEASHPTCPPHVYNPGDSFPASACGDVHPLPNQGPVCPGTLADQFLP